MKPEYMQEKNSVMFAKLDQNNHINHRQLPPQTTLHHLYQVAAGGPPAPLNSSEEAADSRGTVANKNSGLSCPQPISAVGVTPTPPSSVNDGATIEISRRPRGRPPGSKNKPKPPVVITVDSEPSMSPYILELPSGVDLIGSIIRFCRNRNMGLCILTGSGTVSDVTLRQPATAPGPNVIFHGRFDILSISATIFHSNASLSAVSSRVKDFTISLAGPQGQVVGGPVIGPLTSAGPVYLIAASFNNPTYQRLPADDDGNNSGGGNEGSHRSPRAGISGGEESGGAAAEEPCGLPMYSCHMGSDVIWAPAGPRQQAPPPY